MRETLTSPVGKFVDAGGVRLHYHDVGRGYPLVCLHGAGPGASSWGNFRRNVDALAAHYRVLLVDMPQYGRSDKVPITGGRLTYLAGVLDAFMDRMGIDRAHFVGNSMGGQAALKLAITAPARVDRLVVIGAAPILHSVFVPTPVEGVRLIRDYYRGKGPTREKMRRLLETIVFDQSLVTDDLVEERYQASIDPEAVAVFAGPPPENEDLLPQLPQVAAPTLVVWGQEDRFGALDVGLLLVKMLPRARLYVIPRCGHWAHYEHADEFNRMVLRFLTD